MAIVQLQSSRAKRPRLSPIKPDVDRPRHHCPESSPFQFSALPPTLLEGSTGAESMPRSSKACGRRFGFMALVKTRRWDPHNRQILGGEPGLSQPMSSGNGILPVFLRNSTCGLSLRRSHGLWRGMESTGYGHEEAGGLIHEAHRDWESEV